MRENLLAAGPDIQRTMEEQMTDAIYKDSTQPIDARVEDLMSRMTLAEKVGQMIQVNGSRPDAEEWVAKKFIGSFLHVIGARSVELQSLAEKTRLGIPIIFGIDAIHGHALYSGATIFPTQLGMSSSWNSDLVEETGRITAREMAATGMHWTFSPVLCIARDLRWGRIDETFGEDPYLIGELASAIIRGYQGKDFSAPESVLACAKHFAAYSAADGGRDAGEVNVSQRQMRAFYLPAFEAAARAGCATYMAGYQAIDGVPCSANSWLLRKILKGDWRFPGFVVTDYHNAGHMVSEQFTTENIEEASKIAIEAGNDMIMATGDFFEAAQKLVAAGRVDAALIDAAVRRILRLKFALGLFDHKRYADLDAGKKVIGCAEHRAAALDAAYQSMVLLKNENNLLPLSDKKVKRIAVIGPNADDMVAQLGDWVSYGEDASQPPHPRENVVTILDGLKKRAPAGCRVVYAKGCEAVDPRLDQIGEAVEAARGSDVAIVVVGDTKVLHGEWRDRANLDLSGGQQKLLEAVKETGVPMVVVLVNSKPLSIPWVAANADAILEAWNPGMEGGAAVAGLLFGDRAPAGRLTISFPHHVGQQPVYYNQMPGWHGGKYVDMPGEPLYAFGYGLTYTTFACSNLIVANAKLVKGEALKVEVDVENTGAVKATEVVQLYVNDLVSSVTTPVKELKAFARVELKPGQKKTVKLKVPFKSLSLVNAKCKRLVEPGQFDLMVGGSSRDADLLKARFEVTM